LEHAQGTVQKVFVPTSGVMTDIVKHVRILFRVSYFVRGLNPDPLTTLLLTLLGKSGIEAFDPPLKTPH